MRAPNNGSVNDRISRLPIGGRAYIETTLRGWQGVQSKVSNESRRPESMAGMKFSCCLVTGVIARTFGDIRYLVCVERTT